MGVSKACCSWYRAMQVLSLVLIVLAIAVVAASVAVGTRADTLYRACINTAVSPGGEAGAKLLGLIEFDSYDNFVRYTLQDQGVLSQIQALVIRGPVAAGDTTGPVYFSLCGAPNLEVVCDIATTPNAVSGVLRAVNPGALDLRPFILDFRREPHRYYLEVLTSSRPVTPGALHSTLSQECGLP